MVHIRGSKAEGKVHLLVFPPFQELAFFVWKFDGDKLSELADFFFLCISYSELPETASEAMMCDLECIFLNLGRSIWCSGDCIKKCIVGGKDTGAVDGVVEMLEILN